MAVRFRSATPDMTWEDCLKCVHKRYTYTCPASMCRLGKNLPCLSCAAQRRKSGDYVPIAGSKEAGKEYSDFFDCKDYKVKVSVV